MDKQGCCVDGKCTPETCMNIPDGKKCGECRWVGKCLAVINDKTATDTVCDFFPRRFEYYLEDTTDENKTKNRKRNMGFLRVL